MSKSKEAFWELMNRFHVDKLKAIVAGADEAISLHGQPAEYQHMTANQYRAYVVGSITLAMLDVAEVQRQADES